MNSAAPNSRVTEPAEAGFPAEKQRVARYSMAAAAAMTLLKIAAGLLSGSLGVLSDAAHSGLDLVGAALTYFSVHVSDKPADEDHTYGHGKIENLSAFSEAGLMALSCAWIMWEAVERIFFHPVEVHHSLWPVLVLVTSIGVDIWRSRQLREVATRTGSPASGDRRIPFRLGHLGDFGGSRRSWRLLGWRTVPDRGAALCRSAGSTGGIAHDLAHDGAARA